MAIKSNKSRLSYLSTANTSSKDINADQEYLQQTPDQIFPPLPLHKLFIIRFCKMQLPYPAELAKFHSVLAMKSPQDFLVVQHFDGVFLINRSRCMATGEGRFLCDVVYCKFDDKYYLYDSNEMALKQKSLFEKFFENRPCRSVCRFEGSDWFGRTLRIYPDNSRWIVMSENKRVVRVFDTVRKQSFTVDPRLPDIFYDHVCLKGDRVVLLCRNLYLVEVKLLKKQKRVRLLSKQTIQFGCRRPEQGATLCVCPRSLKLGVCTKSEVDLLLSRLLIFSIGKKRGLKVELSLDLWDYTTRFFYALEIMGYDQNKLVVVGLSFDDSSNMYSVVYDTRTRRCMRIKKVLTPAKKPMRVVRIGGMLYGADCSGNFFRLDYI